MFSHRNHISIDALKEAVHLLEHYSILEHYFSCNKCSKMGAYIRNILITEKCQMPFTIHILKTLYLMKNIFQDFLFFKCQVDL